VSAVTPAAAMGRDPSGMDSTGDPDVPIGIGMRSLLALLVLLAWAAPTAAQVAGGGPKDSDCLTEFVAAANKPAKHPKKIRCVDGDPSCDADPTPGVCQFPVDVCFNVSDPDLPACAPREIEFYEVDNVQPDTDPLHDFEFQSLEDQAGAFVLPVDAADTDVCTGPVTMIVALDVKVKKRGAKWKRKKEVLRTTALGPGGWRDDDRLRMTCVPARGADPCDQVTSTFDQIQKHVFDRSCNRQTCHSSAQLEHTLSLAPGEAWAALVGAAPDDATAFAAGKRRVDPGNPANSYLLDKLRGDLGPTQGLRMPRLLPKLQKRKIALIESWIAAGAPETGFVGGVGCGAP
jgi:hypothetical protein